VAAMEGALVLIGSGFDSLNCCNPRCFDEGSALPIPGYFECRVNLLGLT